jgi:predicted P-loop ATPase
MSDELLANVRTFASAAEAATWYVELGIKPVPVAHRGKNPKAEGWEELRIDSTSLASYFNGHPQNVGALLGINGLTDADMDSPEALTLASTFLPATGFIFGRESKPASHRFYFANPPIRLQQFRDPLTKAMLAELRGLKKTDGKVGLQTVVPDSTHPSGESISFEPGYDSAPALVSADALIRAFHKTMAAALLCRYWPAHGRHNTMLALAGALARAGWPQGETLTFCRAVYQAVPTHDRGAVSRIDSEVSDSYAKVAADEPATGFHHLIEHIDKKVVETAFGWLSLKSSPVIPAGEEWRKDLLVTAGGEPKALLANAVMLLRHASEFAGVLSFDEFSLQVAAARKAPWSESIAGAIWTDDDDTRAACWLQRQGVTVSSKVAAEAVQTVAKENRFHPIKRYLESLSWDQSPRLDTWLAEYLGAENSALHSAIGAKWMISGCARIYQPGCQADHTLLLEGPQGARKSTTLRTLAGDEYFADHLSDLGSKDSRIELLGRWIIEMSEFTSRRSELERKSFLTSRADSFRAPYERRARLVPRTCIFAATSNDPVPLTDESGGRRYWCVTVGKIDIEKLRADRDQLWAEAHTRYLAGESWYPDSLEFQAALTTSQAARYQEGPHDEAILAWLENPQPRQFNNHIDRNSLSFDSTPERVTLIDVLIHAVGMAQHAIAQKDQYPVIRCLRHAGWKNKQIRIAGTRRNVRFWEKDSML